MSDDDPQEKPFTGFVNPKQNWSRLPHQLINALPTFSSMAEIVVVLYILRHTWGYKDKRKRITLDEFEHGRKRKNGTRIDAGVGMSKPSIVSGLKSANTHGFIVVEVDDSDKGRVKKFYSLANETVLKSLTPDSQEPLHPSEKETSERNYKKEKENPATPLVTVIASNFPYRDTVASLLTVGTSRALDIVHILQGTSKKFPACNCMPAVSEDEFKACIVWRNGKYMPKGVSTVQTLIAEWRISDDFHIWQNKQDGSEAIDTLPIDRASLEAEMQAQLQANLMYANGGNDNGDV